MPQSLLPTDIIGYSVGSLKKAYTFNQMGVYGKIIEIVQ